MNSGLSFFKSKVAKRIFILFLLCAMLPISIFSFLTYTQASSHLRRQCIQSIQNSAKSYGLILFERFTQLDFELSVIADTYLSHINEINKPVPSVEVYEKTTKKLKSVLFINDFGEVKHILGKTKNIPPPIISGFQSDISPKTSIRFLKGSDNTCRIFLSRSTTGPGNKKGILIAEVNTLKLWGIGYKNILPAMTDFAILDHNRKNIFGSFLLPPEKVHLIRFDNKGLESRSLGYASGDNDFFLAYWPMFLQSKFNGPNLIILLRKNQKDVFKPLSHLKKLFPLVVLLALWLVLLFSISAIRKSLDPLDKLKEGARRLSNRDFGTYVDITSNDEFQEVADTFNKGTAYLERQFAAMEAMAEIDRVVHSSLDKKTIINTGLRGIYNFFGCETITFCSLNNLKSSSAPAVTYLGPDAFNMQDHLLSFSQAEKDKLTQSTDAFRVEIDKPLPSFLSEKSAKEMKQHMIQPLFYNDELMGILCLGFKEEKVFTDDETNYLKGLASLLTSALSNARLVEELELLNWGALEALARTVDAKSNWTAGHSERVAAVAIRIAHALGFKQEEIDNLNRAAFLHDIGKIGIPLQILDKNSQLSDEEYDQIKTHPEIGAKIIEPIEVYADAVPIIQQHHEKFNGTGYPQGLSGDEIVLGARILAVADAYDAMIADRPYRQGAVKEKVLNIIKSESGRHFDPMVVEAFLSTELAC